MSKGGIISEWFIVFIGLRKFHNPYLILGTTTRRSYSTFAFSRDSLRRKGKGTNNNQLLLSSSLLLLGFNLLSDEKRRGLSDFHVLQLEARANSETDNPVAQAQYLSVITIINNNYYSNDTCTCTSYSFNIILHKSYTISFLTLGHLWERSWICH